MPRVLVACEMSGRVRTAFAKRGWDAWSCDLLPDESRMWNPDGACSSCDPCWGYHYQGDITNLFNIDLSWDLIIGHPPCTDLSQAGARYWKEKQADGRQEMAAEFFKMLYFTPLSRTFVVIENPVGIMCRTPKDGGLFRPPDQTVEPWWFGDPLSKKICLWYRQAWRPSYAKRGISTRDLREFDLPHLVADKSVVSQGRVTTGGGSWKTDKKNGKTHMNNWEDSQGRARREILRSITSAEVARAMADQWGPYVENLCD